MHRYLIILFIWSGISTTALSQAATEDDFVCWIGFETEWNFHKKWSAEMRTEIRLQENASRIRNFYFQPFINYSPLHWLKLSVGYRWDERYRYQQDYFYEHHRAMVQAEASYEKKRWKLSWRTRFQSTWTTYHEPGSEIPELYIRNQPSVRYKWPKINLYTSLEGELWFRLNRGEIPIDRVRIVLGNEYRITRMHRIKLNFLFQQPLGEFPLVRQWGLIFRYALVFGS